MRASLIAPALTVWLMIGLTMCLVFSAPWYVGVIVGLVAGAITYLVWPKLAKVPAWLLHLSTAAVFASGAVAPNPGPGTWFAGAAAVLQLFLAGRSYLRRHESQHEPFD